MPQDLRPDDNGLPTKITIPDPFAKLKALAKAKRQVSLLRQQLRSEQVLPSLIQPLTEKEQAVFDDLIAGKRAEVREQEGAYDTEIAAERKQARLEGRTGEQIEQTEVAGESEAQGEVAAAYS